MHVSYFITLFWYFDFITLFWYFDLWPEETKLCALIRQYYRAVSLFTHRSKHGFHIGIY